MSIVFYILHKGYILQGLLRVSVRSREGGREGGTLNSTDTLHTIQQARVQSDLSHFNHHITVEAATRPNSLITQSQNACERVRLIQYDSVSKSEGKGQFERNNMIQKCEKSKNIRREIQNKRKTGDSENYIIFGFGIMNTSESDGYNVSVSKNKSKIESDSECEGEDGQRERNEKTKKKTREKEMRKRKRERERGGGEKEF